MRAPGSMPSPAMLIAVALLLVGRAPTLRAQDGAAGDTLHLRELLMATLDHDPRTAQLDLLSTQTELRLGTLSAERLPALRLHAQGQVQSDVPSIPFELPGGVQAPMPPRDGYDAHLAVQQSLYDPSLAPRRAVEEARLAESRARVATSLYELRRRVEEAFFTVLLRDAQQQEVEAAVAALRAQLEVAEDRVDEGAALPSEAATLRREILRRQQLRDELRTAGESARAVLTELSGRSEARTAPLALPDLRVAVRGARASLAEFPGRPEAERFARAHELLDRQAQVIGSRERPRFSAFGRSGYGRPGLNPLARELDSYWLGGVQVEWAPWSWSATRNEQQELRLQREILRSEEEAFAAELRRGAISELGTIDRLQGSLDRDAEVVALSEAIAAETRVRFREAVVTAADLAQREAELLEARLGLVVRTIELEHARARFLTLTGHELP